MSQPVVVLGAGCAGLSAARRLRELGRPVLVLEAEDHVGGLAGGARFDGDVYEYGPHIFHTTDAAILSDVKALMGPDLLPYERTIRIKFLGAWFTFPLQIGDVLGKLPLATTVHAGLSFLWHAGKGLVVRPPEHMENSETVLKREYGAVLYKLFFEDYIRKVWGIPPSAFSPSFARERIPRFNILEALDKIATALTSRFRPAKAVSTEGFVEKVEGELFTTRRGFSLICDRMAETLRAAGGEIRLGAKAAKISRDGARAVSVTLASGETIACSGLVNTLAINAAPLMLEPSLGPDVERAAKSLRFRAIVFVGLKVKRERVLPASFVYFREHSFNRVTDMSYFKLRMDPGTTLLVAEVACAQEDAVWSDDAVAREAVLADLEREGLIRRDEVARTVVYRTAHGQPMYTLGYEDALKTAIGALEGLANAATAGRQGRFAYVNTHVAMKMGREAADRLHAKLGPR